MIIQFLSPARCEVPVSLLTDFTSVAKASLQISCWVSVSSSSMLRSGSPNMDSKVSIKDWESVPAHAI